MKKRIYLKMAGLLAIHLTMFFGVVAVAETGDPSGAKVFELGEVVITGKGEAVSQATTVTEVTEKDIEAIGATTVGEALDMIPGVDIQTHGKQGDSIVIRGFSQSDAKVLIDGVPAHETWFRSVDLSAFPVDAISKITITKGASSVLYGANTMGGVINIITKKGGEEPFTQFTSSFGDYSTQHYALNHGASVGKFNYWLTYSYQKSDGFRLSSDFDEDSEDLGEGSDYNEDGGKRDLSDYRRSAINAKIGYETDDNTSLYLSFDYHSNERGCPTFFSRYWDFTNWDQWHLNLVGEKRINDLVTVKARAFYVDHEDSLEDVSWDADHTTSKKWFERSYYDDYSIGGELHTFLDFGKWSFLKVAFNYIRDNHKENDFLDEDSFDVIKGWATTGWQGEEEAEADTYTWALEDEIRPTDRLSFVVGLSYDYHDPRKIPSYVEEVIGDVPDSDGVINPQLGVVYKFTDDTRFHASVGQKTRFPHMMELYNNMGGGNPDLKEQKTKAYEIGAEHYFAKSVKGWISYFYNDVEDLIERVDLPEGGDWRYENIGEARFQGVEGGLDHQVSDNFWVGANYT
ncbi:MAG: TonB-dependent receptor, partial [Thermodesulfobacteriota bacterium]|nr:TonB-dependent receptor [Thermodesulfobacteriota bacterium]